MDASGRLVNAPHLGAYGGCVFAIVNTSFEQCQVGHKWESTPTSLPGWDCRAAKSTS